jgi:hypothetical protein
MAASVASLRRPFLAGCRNGRGEICSGRPVMAAFSLNDVTKIPLTFTRRRLSVPGKMGAIALLQRFVCGGLLAAQISLVPMKAAKVDVVGDDSGRWQLWRNGAPYVVRGVGGYGHLELAAASGATTLRTWSVTALEEKEGGQNLLDRAHTLNLTVIAGLWVRHPRHGFDYGNAVALQKQREEIRAAVRRYKAHPALLVWGLGNEIELGHDSSDIRLWRELEVLARIVKEEDPNHPVMTVLAGGGTAKISSIQTHCPSIDILGINSYGPATLVNTMLDDAGWMKAYMLTEFGPRGPWEVQHTPWGAPVEPGSAEKVASYIGAQRSALADPRGRCLGTFAFLWGQKQEVTATWFGLFLPTGEKTPVVDALAREFTGRWPVNRSPQIRSLKTALAGDRVGAGREFAVTVEADDSEHDPLTYEWQVVAESSDRKSGGDKETPPPVIAGCFAGPGGPAVTVRTPDQSGAYRLFVTVRDGRGGGCSENVPFFVQP